ncbi:MAG: glycoside hydrolase [Prevotellaceae bacterium]|nr:glycoside hydrolase [Prevotellaceae bacterium]
MRRTGLFLLAACLLTGLAASAQILRHEYAVDVNDRRQTLEGWGVSLCWWANMCGKWDEESVDRIVDWMVSPEGLNWNIFRYNIGGGDDPDWMHCGVHHMGKGKGLRAEMEGFLDERGGSYNWERDAAQRRIMLKIRERRPDAVFEAFSNSPPWWMTVSGCAAGNGDAGADNLRTDYYEDFARYLVDVCRHYRDEYGIEFKTLEPFNEPVTNYWYQSGSQEGCHFDAKSQVAFLRVLAPMLRESGLRTVISASDETCTAHSLSVLREYVESGAIDLIGQWNTHTYSADAETRRQVGALARESGKTLWMSESGSGGKGLEGNLGMARRLIDDMRDLAPVAWLDWQYMEENNDQWCLVQGDFAAGTCRRVKNYYVRQHFTRFIRQGHHIVGSGGEGVLAAVSPRADTLTVVILGGSEPCAHRLSLPGASVRGEIRAWRTDETNDMRLLDASLHDIPVASGNILDVYIPENTITTLVVPLKPPSRRGRHRPAARR